MRPDEDSLLIERRGATGWITFNRPLSRNALTMATYDRLAQACRRFAEDSDVRVIGLRGAGTEAFAAGTHIDDLKSINNGTDGIAYEQRVEAALHELEFVAKPTVALLFGAVVGGGAAIALACDMRIAAKNLRFGIPIARTVGNCLSPQNLHRLMEVAGPALTLDLIYTGRLVEAEEAIHAGLVSHVASTGEAESVADDLTDRLSRNAPLTLRTTKMMVGRIRSSRRSQMQDADFVKWAQQVYSSNDFKEGIAAFKERRPPRWTGS